MVSRAWLYPVSIAHLGESHTFVQALKYLERHRECGFDPAMLEVTTAFEDAAENAIRDYVLNTARLGIYDPNQPRRPKMDVVSFQIELLEIDDTDSIVHAAGPVILRTPNGDLEQFLRISTPMRLNGSGCEIPQDAEVRAAYIVDTGHPSGGCKETAALANT